MKLETKKDYTILIVLICILVGIAYLLYRSRAFHGGTPQSIGIEEGFSDRGDSHKKNIHIDRDTKKLLDKISQDQIDKHKKKCKKKPKPAPPPPPEMELPPPPPPIIQEIVTTLPPKKCKPKPKPKPKCPPKYIKKKCPKPPPSPKCPKPVYVDCEESPVIPKGQNCGDCMCPGYPDMDKYILKSKIESQQSKHSFDKNKYMLKTEVERLLQKCKPAPPKPRCEGINLDDYILKSKVKASGGQIDMSKYILKTEIPGCIPPEREHEEETALPVEEEQPVVMEEISPETEEMIVPPLTEEVGGEDTIGEEAGLAVEMMDPRDFFLSGADDLAFKTETEGQLLKPLSSQKDIAMSLPLSQKVDVCKDPEVKKFLHLDHYPTVQPEDFEGTPPGFVSGTYFK